MVTPKPVSFIFGLFLVFVGAAALFLNSGLSFFGFHINSFNLWPLFIVGLGLAFGIAPFTSRGKPGLGGLFIPAMILITNGLLLSLGSIFHLWGVWAHLWPLELLAIATAFILFSIYSRNAWLLIPALFIGANGAILLFCAVTGLWGSWAVLWTVEPLCVGLMLLLIARKSHSVAVMTVGLVISAFSLMAAAGMSSLLNGYLQFAGTLGAICFIIAGTGLLLSGNKSFSPPPTAPRENL